MSLKAKIASLVVDLSANSASFNAELKKSKKETSAWAEEVKNKAKIGGLALAAAATAATAGLTALARQRMVDIDSMTKHADKIGISTQALAGLRHQAELNGVAQNNLDMGLQRMVRRVAEAANGTGEAVSALAELRLNAQAMKQMSPDQQFAAIAERMKDIDSQSDRVRIAFKLFDSEGVGLVNTMRDGAAGISAATAEAEALGLAVSRVDAAKIEAANDAGYRASQVWTGLGNTLAVKVSPYIAAMKTEFFNSAVEANGFRDVVDKAMSFTVKAIGYVGNAIRGMQLLWKGAQLLVATFVATSLQNLESLAQGAIKVTNLLPFVDVKLDPNSGIALMADVARARVAELKDEMHAVAMQELPSEKIEKWSNDVVENATAAAKAVAKVAESTQAGSQQVTDDQKPTATAKDAERVSSELTRGTEHYLEAYERRQQIIDNALAAKQISEERHFEISKQNWSNYQNAIAEEAVNNHKMMVDSSKGFFANLATLSDHGNKKLAAIGRAAARINVAISTIEAAQNAYTWAAKWGGVPAGVAAAAAATIAGLMRLRAINTAGSGSGSTGSGGLSGGTTFDQNLPNAAATVSDIPGGASRRDSGRVVIQGDYYAQGAVQAMDSESFAEFAQRNRSAIANATESELNEYGRSLVA